MITDVFPKAGGTPLTMKTKPYEDTGYSIQAPTTASATTNNSICWRKGCRQTMAPGSRGVLYVIGENDQYGILPHLIKVVYTPLNGSVTEWRISDFSVGFSRIVVDSNDCVYAVRTNGNLEKYDATGALLWTVADSGVLSIGANGNLFVWTATDFKEYSADGTILSTWKYTCDGTPLTFYVSADNEFFIATSTQLARIKASLEVAWTYSASFKYDDYLTAVDIDHKGNFYMYDVAAKAASSSVVGVQCVNSDGALVWATGQLYYSFQYVNIWVDNLGAVYLVCYGSKLFKLDANNGATLWTASVGSTNYKGGAANAYGDVYVWYYSLQGWHNYLGTVNWTEDEVTKEKFVLQEIERGDGYMILLSDEEVTAQ